LTRASEKDALFLSTQEPDKGASSMEKKGTGQKIAIFFCQVIDADQDVNSRPLEEESNAQISFSPCHAAAAALPSVQVGGEFDSALNNE
jgi:hypothetical protein